MKQTPKLCKIKSSTRGPRYASISPSPTPTGCLRACIVLAGGGRRKTNRVPSSSRRARVAALLQANIRTLSNVDRKVLAELLDVLSVDLLREAKCSVDDIRVEPKETLSHLQCSSVCVVESGHELGRGALVVDLVMDGALREHSALELGECPCDFGVLVGCDEAVLEDVAEVDLTLNHGEELGRARVDVRRVNTTCVEETKRGRDTQVSEDGEGLDVLLQY